MSKECKAARNAIIIAMLTLTSLITVLELIN
jgi:hypothetical protein